MSEFRAAVEKRAHELFDEGAHVCISRGAVVRRIWEEQPWGGARSSMGEVNKIVHGVEVGRRLGKVLGAAGLKMIPVDHKCSNCGHPV